MKTIIFRSFILFIALSTGLATQGFSQKKGEIISVTAEQFQKKIEKTKNVQLIDVRTLTEYETGHINRSVNWDILNGDFVNHIPQLNKKKPVLIYCRSGNKSMRASKILAEKGFKVVNLKPGILGWEKDNMPVTKE